MDEEVKRLVRREQPALDKLEIAELKEEVQRLQAEHDRCVANLRRLNEYMGLSLRPSVR